MIVRRIARPLVAAPFIYSGVEAALKPAGHVEVARPLTDTITEKAGIKPLTDTQLSLAVRGHGVATAVLGAAMALGVFPRTASLGLVGLTAPLAVVSQPVVGVPKGERGAKIATFAQKLGLIGAALITAIDTEAKPGITWRTANARTQHQQIASVKRDAQATIAALKAEAA
ncbi:MAG: DoxX family membrane protein [Cellulomonadaceae bacterium]|jgi:uncharacterized membrane protein YphA (DoxX/SURF4 family)|nr:DoxX family membrane protein [Cellulomonadaceae bacterium]